MLSNWPEIDKLRGRGGGRGCVGGLYDVIGGSEGVETIDWTEAIEAL